MLCHKTLLLLILQMTLCIFILLTSDTAGYAWGGV